MTGEPKPRLGPASWPIGERPQPGEQFFQQSIADLSRRLGERAGKRGAAEMQAAAEERRRAMQAYERERARKLRLGLTGAGAVLATACLTWFVVILGEPEAPMSATPVAAAQPAPSAIVAAAEPAAPPPQPAA